MVVKEAPPTPPALLELKLSILNCTTCGEFTERKVKKTGEIKRTPLVKIRAGQTRLTDSSSSPVPSFGSISPKYLFIGEAPGENEDEEGEPFIGRSGRYLKKVLLKLAGIQLSDCRFTNVVKCHPLRNRDPYASEIKACMPWLEAEIDLLQPEVIFTLGRISTQALLGKNKSTQLKNTHGQLFEWNGYPVMPLYHPASVNRAVPEKVMKNDFKTILSKIESNLESETSEDGETSFILRRPNEKNFHLVDGSEKLGEFLSKLEGKKQFGLDLETNESKWARERDQPDPVSNEIAGIAVTYKDDNEEFITYYIPTCGHKASGVSYKDFGVGSWTDQTYLVCALLQPHIRRAEVFMHNAKFDIETFDKYGVKFRKFFCTYLAGYALREETLGLKEISKRRYSISMYTLDDVIDIKKQQIRDAPLALVFIYGCADSDYCFRYGLNAKEMLKEEGSEEFYKMQLALLPWVIEEELTGIETDADKFEEIDPYFKDRIGEIEQGIFAEAGYEFNMNSAQQKSKLLFEDWGLPETPLTVSGFPTTDKGELEKIAYADPIIETFMEHGSLTTIRSTFIKGIPKLVNPLTWRLHANINQGITQTSRLSYTKPDWQNLPVRMTEAKRVREVIIADEVGWWIIAVDQSQIELRWAAHLSEDAWMIDVFRSGRSIHKETCQEIYGITEEDKDWDGKYKNSKNGNFARLYGAGKFKLSETLHISVNEAEHFLKRHESLMQGFARWVESMHKLARKQGYVETHLGFRRYLPNIRGKNSVMRSRDERLSINVPIQGSSANHIQLAMIAIYKEMKRKKMASRMMIQVHDELIFSAPEEEVVEIAGIAVKHFESAIKLSVPTPAEVEVGVSWGELVSFDEWTNEQGIVIRI